MDDIFYLCSEKIKLDDIKEIAEGLEAKEIIFANTLDVMHITYCDNTTTNWTLMNLEEFHEPEDKTFFIKKEIRVVFCISYHPVNLKNLKIHLIEVLKNYGGWIGMDSEGFFPYYNLENIDDFVE